MNVQTNVDSALAQELSKVLLVGSSLFAFCFDSNFVLKLMRLDAESYRGWELPRSVELHLLGEWRMGEQDAWLERTGGEAPEPLQAYCAAELWKSGATVTEVYFLADRTEFVFGDEQVLSVDIVSQEGEPNWVLKAEGQVEPRITWLVSRDSGEYYTRVPG